MLSTLAMSLLMPSARAGLSIGGVTSTNKCYDAMQNAKRPGEEVIDRDGYVVLIDGLSDGAFTAFGQDDSGEWGMFPVTDFNDLPKAVRDEFYNHACGGPNVICDNAFLYADGSGVHYDNRT